MGETDGRRIFTFEEAVRVLPEVRERTRAALEKLEGLGDADDEPDEEEDESPEETLGEEATAVVRAWAEEIAALGVEVKGPWLVDFDSGAGYYCWKWPEDSLEFFHSYEEGFAGRVRLQ